MATVASAPADFSVFRTLAGSTATLGRAAALGDGIAISQWSRSAHETMGYDNHDIFYNYTLQMIFIG